MQELLEVEPRHIPSCSHLGQQGTLKPYKALASPLTLPVTWWRACCDERQPQWQRLDQWGCHQGECGPGKGMGPFSQGSRVAGLGVSSSSFHFRDKKMKLHSLSGLLVTVKILFISVLSSGKKKCHFKININNSYSFLSIHYIQTAIVLV